MIWSKLTAGITGIFTKRKLDGEALAALEDLLIEADLGAKTASELVAALSKQLFDKDISPEAVRAFLAGEIAKILEPVAVPLIPDTALKPSVILVLGVNGSGKTTTIGKLASRFKAQGKSVMLAAADTFRAAAVEQLQEWGRRSDIPVIAGEHESDPASVAYKAYEQAQKAQSDILLIDTAGRLHNKSNLMAELQKICKVLKKIDASAPHHIIQVLDATIGQNTIAQVQAFKEMVDITGLIITKLDGTAKAGVLVAIARQFHIPVHAIGLGEGVRDLKDFQPIDFSRNLVGLTT
jgi:fused signal recognition particle receptor